MKAHPIQYATFCVIILITLLQCFITVRIHMMEQRIQALEQAR
jgi:hypothetical protein